METKHIIYKNFNNKNKQLNKKKLNNFIKFKNLIEKYPLLKSLTNNYNYSFQKKNLLNLSLKVYYGFSCSYYYWNRCCCYWCN